jgi:ubiquitin carboxyl-terminal hydrolase 10
VQEQMPEQSATPSEGSPLPQPEARRQSVAANPLALAPEHKMPFYPKLPWYSTDDGANTFPQKARRRRRRRQNLNDIDSVAFPSRDVVEEDAVDQVAEEPISETSTLPAPSEPETPATSQAPSENDYTAVSTPATPAQATISSPKPTANQTTPQHTRKDTRTAIAVPNISGIGRPKPSPPATSEKSVSSPAPPAVSTPTSDAPKTEQANDEQTEVKAAEPVAPPPKPAPKSWADLVRRNAPPPSPGAALNGAFSPNGVQIPKSASLADALRQYSVQSDATLSFLEPRGLVNTGNMCYMNSVSRKC